MSHQLYGKLGKPSQLVMLHCQEICAWQVTAQLCQRFVEQISHQRDTALSECSSLTCEMRAEKVQGSPILVKVGVNFHIYIYKRNQVNRQTGPMHRLQGKLQKASEDKQEATCLQVHGAAVQAALVSC